MEPVVIEPVMMKQGSDCGVASLAMLLGKTYSEVLAAVPKRYRKDVNNGEGLSQRQLTNIAKRLGFVTRWEHNGDLSETVGVLDVHRPKTELDQDGEWEGHFLILAKGALYNPADGVIWTDIASFFNSRRWRPKGVLVRVEEE